MSNKIRKSMIFSIVFLIFGSFTLLKCQSDLVVTLGSDQVKIWDVNTGKELAKGQLKKYIIANEDVSFVQVSPKGGKMITIAGEVTPTIKIWDLFTGNDVTRVDLSTILQVYELSAVFSEDCTKLAILEKNNLKIFNIKSGKKIATRNMVGDKINFFDGNKVVFKSGDKIKVRDIKTGKDISKGTLKNFVLARSEYGDANMFDVNSGKIAAVGSNRNGYFVKIFDMATGNDVVKSNIVSSNDEIKKVYLSEDGKKVIYLFVNGKFGIRDVDTGKDIVPARSDLAKYNETMRLKVARPNDGKMVSVGNKDSNKTEVRVWDLSSGKDITKGDLKKYNIGYAGKAFLVSFPKGKGPKLGKQLEKTRKGKKGKKYSDVTIKTLW